MNSFISAGIYPTCSHSIELTSAMYKVNNKDTRTTSFNVFLVSFVLTLNKFTPCSSVSIADFEQVNLQWVEGSIILVGNDVLPR